MGHSTQKSPDNSSNIQSNVSPLNPVQSIPVLNTGPVFNPDKFTKSNKPSYSDVVIGKTRSIGKVMVLGTSITRGSGIILNEKGFDATTYTYGEAYEPHIRSRLQEQKMTPQKPLLYRREETIVNRILLIRLYINTPA